MRVIDAHCDLLMKMVENRRLGFDHDGRDADVSLNRLKQAEMAVQIYAIFLPDRSRLTFEQVLEQVRLFMEHIAAHPDAMFIRTKEELEQSLSGHKLGSLLSLEGVDGLEGSLTYLHTLYYLGVRLMGITWNEANWAADGVGETRKAGFSVKGRQFVKECAKLGIILDVSHLSEPGFWELLELSDKPFIASHSNAYALCPHPRNLSDEQIEAIVKRGGRIGITFVPPFLSKERSAVMKDVLKHLDRICSLGGAGHVGFGSDFDGIDAKVQGLEHTGCYGNLAKELQKHYSEAQVESFMHGNWLRFLREQLPSGSFNKM
ncbi:dipeptidase [Paenibacillus sp. MBLB4367]|uniref:dipeptidase n=1 Tax=Paenibacillus sp. MBLB4367 TaxID=3384767 RepID=UPI003908168B